MSKTSFLSVAVFGLMSFTTMAAHGASFSVSTDGGGTGNNLIFNGCNAPVTSGMTLSGCINSDHSLIVEASGTEALKVVGGGQASIQGADGSLTSLKIDPTNFLASLMILNITASANGYVTFNDALGASAITIAVSGNGNNFFTLTGGDLNFITLASTTPNVYFSAVEQVRFDIASVSAVPEPQEWMLLLSGLSIVGAIARRRQAA
jgi:hypothetical protein